MNECCGTCKFHNYVKLSSGSDWCCCNPDSDYVGLETEYKDYCEYYEEREGRKNE